MAPRIPTRAALLPVIFLAATACAKQPAATFEVVEAPPPRIDSISHGAPDGAHPGDTVSLTLKGDPGLRASAEVSTLAASVPLAEDPGQGGLYHGSVRVPEGKTGSFDLTGRLEAEASRVTTLAGPPLRVINPPAPPADLARRSMTAADFNARKVLGIVYFDFDAFVLRDDARATLAGNLEWLAAHAGLKVVVEGHCDEKGTNEYNLGLGDRRANAVRDYLIAGGLPASRVRTVSYGEERPADPGHEESAWARNRRAEFLLED